MKFVIIISTLFLLNFAQAETTIYGGAFIPEQGDIGFLAGAGWFNKKFGPATFGIDASYSSWSFGVGNSSIIEGMAMFRFGGKIFVDIGLGLDYFTSQITSGTIKTAFGANAGYRISKFVLGGRIRVVDSAKYFGAFAGFNF